MSFSATASTAELITNENDATGKFQQPIIGATKMTLTIQEQQRRSDVIAGLRDFLAFMESHEDFPAPEDDFGTVNVWAKTKEQFLEMRRMAGAHEKIDGSSWITFHKDFSGGLRLEINISKALTCKRVKVGVKVVPAKPAIVLEAEPEHVEDAYEWRCEEPLLAPTEQPAKVV